MIQEPASLIRRYGRRTSSPIPSAQVTVAVSVRVYSSAPWADFRAAAPRSIRCLLGHRLRTTRRLSASRSDTYSSCSQPLREVFGLYGISIQSAPRDVKFRCGAMWFQSLVRLGFISPPRPIPYPSASPLAPLIASRTSRTASNLGAPPAAPLGSRRRIAHKSRIRRSQTA